jgi:hypothetical protein
VNLLLGAPPSGVALQIFFAGTGAAGLAALRIRTGSLWPGIVLHAAYDLAFRLMDLDASTGHGKLYYTLHGLGWLIFAVVVLRPGARGQRSVPSSVASCRPDSPTGHRRTQTPVRCQTHMRRLSIHRQRAGTFTQGGVAQDLSPALA